MNYLINIFKIDQSLIFKEIKLSKLSNIIKFCGIIIAILIVIKYFTSLLPKAYLAKEFFALSIAFLGLFKIRIDKILNRQIQMLTFFPSISKSKIKKYFLYKKTVIVYLITIYFLFPINKAFFV